MPKKRTRGNGEGSIFKRQEGGPWYITWYGADGKRKTHCAKTTDKTTAQRILADKLADVALRRDGVIDARQESLAIESRKPIETHLGDFRAAMEARHRTPKHVQHTMYFVRDVCSAAGFETPNDIAADGLNKFISEMTAKKKAPRTIQGASWR
jgi:hypothetical protein